MANRSRLEGLPAWRRIALASLALVPLVGLVVHLVRFLRLSLADKLSYIPDDGFYYLQLGRELQRSHVWSFDRGRSLTSGFHTLFAYACALIERLLSGDGAAHARVMVHATLGVVVTSIAIVLLRHSVEHHFPRGSLLATLLVGGAAGVFMLPLQLMEWPLAVLVSSVLFFAYAKGKPVLVMVALVLAPLCRTDLAFLGGALALAHASVEGLGGPAQRRRFAQMIVATVAGFALVTAHTYIWTGELVQTSARVKAYWGSVMGYSLWYGMEPASYAFSPALVLTRVLDFGPKTLVVPVVLLVAAYAVGRHQLRAHAPAAVSMRRAATLAVVGYALLYGRIGTAAQCWYSACFVAPMFVLVASLAEAMPERVRRGALAVAALLAFSSVWDARRPIWNATGVYEALETLRRSDRVPLAAAWNAGRLNYFGGERAVNIDGLVNDDVLPYLKRGAIHCYLVHERIPFIVDDPSWPTPENAKYLGFSNGLLMAALEPADIFPSGPFVWRVDLDRLDGDPECRADRRSARSRSARPYVPGSRGEAGQR